jgi:hypothetical protein
MAFHVEFQEPFRANFVMLSVSKIVGRYKSGWPGTNLPDDVMLVQWLLARYMDTNNYLGPPLLVDGNYGAQTDYHLTRFLFNIKEWGRKHQIRTRSGISLQVPDELETVVYPLFEFGGMILVGVMGRMGEFDPDHYYTLIETMPPMLKNSLHKNVKIYPRDWQL